MHQSETLPPHPPPPLQMAPQESPPPTPPPLDMETAPPQPPPPPPPPLPSQMGTEIEPQQFPLQIPPPDSLPRSPPPLEHQQQQPPSQTLPLPPAMQNTASSVTSLPPPPGRRPAGPAPVLASINPTLNSGPVKWSTGLCGCHKDFHNCFITCCCPCITFGEISEIVDRGSSSCVMNGLIYGLLLALLGCACLYSCTYRERMRRQFNLKGNACGDCCVHFCCELCALCQEYRELKSQGFDLSKGWDAQTDLRAQGVMLAPTTHTGMNR